MPVTVVALAERGPGERRVALVPEVVASLVRDGHSVGVEKGAGAAAWHADSAYEDAGASVVTRAQALAQADIVAVVGRPDAATLKALRPGQVLVGLLGSRGDARDLDAAAARGAVPLCLERLPRQVSRAQTMDALSSQASVAGYRAVLVAAEAYGRYLPMMITAAGTARPARVLVLGAGVAGLQAIGTARRLGAQVTGYDVRPAAREEVTSLGAAFLDVATPAAEGEGGYARTLTAAEAKAQQADLAAKIAGFDIVITTAQVPGGKPPLLVPRVALQAMAPGSVVVDLAAGPQGGNVAGSEPGTRVVTAEGVTVIGGDRLASEMAGGASAAYARNIAAVVAAITADGALALDPGDEVVRALWVGAPAPPAESADAPPQEAGQAREAATAGGTR